MNKYINIYINIYSYINIYLYINKMIIIYHHPLAKKAQVHIFYRRELKLS